MVQIVRMRREKISKIVIIIYVKLYPLTIVWPGFGSQLLTIVDTLGQSRNASQTNSNSDLDHCGGLVLVLDQITIDCSLFYIAVLSAS